MSINWTPVTQRVPDDRRNVLVWGFGITRKGRCLGVSRCNVSKSGHRFDCEADSIATMVTHWAEIEPPDGYIPPSERPIGELLRSVP